MIGRYWAAVPAILLVMALACGDGAPEPSLEREVIPWMGRALQPGDTCETVGEPLIAIFNAWVDGERATFIEASCTQAGDASTPPAVRWWETDAFRSPTVRPGDIFLPLGRPLRVGELCGPAITDALREVMWRSADPANQTGRIVGAGCNYAGPNTIPLITWAIKDRPYPGE